jgi:hypothetical protein
MFPSALEAAMPPRNSRNWGLQALLAENLR